MPTMKDGFNEAVLGYGRLLKRFTGLALLTALLLFLSADLERALMLVVGLVGLVAALFTFAAAIASFRAWDRGGPAGREQQDDV